MMFVAGGLIWVKTVDRKIERSAEIYKYFPKLVTLQLQEYGFPFCCV